MFLCHNKLIDPLAYLNTPNGVDITHLDVSDIF